MGFININNHLLFDRRQTEYCSSVAINETQINLMVQDFDGMFDNFIKNITTDISSLIFYPVPIRTTKDGKLSTSKGTSDDVLVSEIEGGRNYFYLGEYYVERHFNNFADYDGYTQMKVFLPLLGYVDVNINECLNQYLQFRLYVDFSTGKGMYIIGVSPISLNAFMTPPYANDTTDNTYMRIINTYETNVGIEMPLGSSNIGDIRRNILLGTIKTIATASVGAASIGQPISQRTSYKTTTADVYQRGTQKGSRMKQTMSANQTTVTESVTEKADSSRVISDTIDSSINTLNNNYIRGNSDRINDAGLTNIYSRYVQIVFYRPRFVYVKNYGSLYGFPLGKVEQLFNLQGYTEINKVHVEGTAFRTATEAEKEEIHKLLLNGVIL